MTDLEKLCDKDIHLKANGTLTTSHRSDPSAVFGNILTDLLNGK